MIAGCFLNLTACAERAVTLLQRPAPPGPPLDEEASDGLASRDPDGIVIACAGRSTLPILDNTYCAGALVEKLQLLLPRAELRDSAHIALAVRKALPVESAFRASESGVVMAGLGLQEEIVFCARRDLYTCVPEARLEGDLLIMKPSINRETAQQQEAEKVLHS